MIKNIVFDIGNVLLEFKPHEYFKDVEQGKEISDYIFHHETWEKFDQGLVTFTQVRDVLSEERPESKELIHYIMKEWLNVLKPKEYTLQKLKDLKQEGYHVYLLSNLALDATNHIKKKYSFFDEVDGYIVSYQEKVNKPDIEIYQRLVDKYDLIAEECVFLDDLLPNIEAARAFGMQGIVFESDEQVEKELSILLDGMNNVE